MQKPDPNILKGNLDLILLEILEPAPMYGLEIINEAQSRTDGYFDFTGGPRRKYYRLTDKGNHALRQKREQWQQFNRAIEALRGSHT
jgi:PadR family transcriptional regulator, regulatory protein PadR